MTKFEIQIKASTLNASKRIKKMQMIIQIYSKYGATRKIIEKINNRNGNFSEIYNLDLSKKKNNSNNSKQG